MSAVVVEVASRRLIRVQGMPGARLAPPGSTLKPIVIEALLRTQKIDPGDAFPCPRALTIGGRSFRCSHPTLPGPVGIQDALAYSCNCFVAHFAQRFAAGELAGYLERAGLVSRTGWLGDTEVSGRIRNAGTGEATQLQALGEDAVLVTAAGLANAYRGLAGNASQPILEGLEDAVEFGTAQHAKVKRFSVAGKTGSVRTLEGVRIAWFAGFAPSRAPRVVVAVALQGHSGGGDAAPIAARLLEAYRAGTL